MAESGTGIIFTQSGVPVKGSADYQRVYDSRWKFLEIEFDRKFVVDLPYVPGIGTSKRHDERVNIVQHGLGFVPMFETDFVNQDYSTGVNGPAEIFADEQYVFFQRFITTSGADAQKITLNIRLYNLNVLTSYTAPKGLPQGSQSPRSNIGIKFLDGQTPGVEVGDNAVRGFSVDTTKKIISIHKHGLAKINDWNGKYCYVSAIDTGTDILTIYVDPNASSLNAKDISWTKTPGICVTYFPNDFVTFPGGIPNANNVSSPLFVIPVDDTHIKLAISYENALQGIALDLTSAGSLRGQLSARSTSGDLSETILHDVGYSPTFLLAPVSREIYVDATIKETKPYVSPMMDIILARVIADTRYLYFYGVQATFSGWYAYIVLKDPAELAR